jgi:hypothetical protein
MATLNQLSTATTLTSSDQIIFYSTINGSGRKASLATLLDWIEGAWMSPTFQRVTASPTLAGFTLALPTTANSLFVLLTPTGTMATGTIVLPAAASAADGQEIVLYTSQEVTVLSFTLNGATALNGAPTGIQAGASLTLRYDALSLAWYTISKPSSLTIQSGTFTPVYNGSGIVGTVTFDGYYQRVGNQVTVDITITTEAASTFTFTTAFDNITNFPAAIVPSGILTAGNAIGDGWTFALSSGSGITQARFQKSGSPTFTQPANTSLRYTLATYMI